MDECYVVVDRLKKFYLDKKFMVSFFLHGEYSVSTSFDNAYKFKTHHEAAIAAIDVIDRARLSGIETDIEVIKAQL